MQLNPANIPVALKERPQWIVWRLEKRGEESTKVPYCAKGGAGKSNDATTWSIFDVAWSKFSAGGYTGIGFVFSAEDEFCGIDLDGCRDPETREWSEWAREIIKVFDTYTELSPSGSGAKMFVRGKCPLPSGKKTLLSVEGRGGKEAGIEVYDKLRYFAVTGLRLNGSQPEPQPRQEVLDRYCKEWFKPDAPATHVEFFASSEVIERARRYVSKLPIAVSGQRGHDAAFTVACRLVLGFGLGPDEAFSVMSEWSQGCQPPWNEREIRHKLSQADKQPGERNYLRNVRPEHWERTRLPTHKPPAEPPKSTTLHASAQEYLKSIEGGAQTLLSLGLPNVDYAIGGGVERGELIVVAARPSHGKSCVGLQAAYSLSADGHSGLFLSEEMSRFALGKRAVQYATSVPGESWTHRSGQVATDVEAHFEARAPIYVVESCGTAERAEESIRQHVVEHGITFVVVDYGQLLGGKGANRYEQVTQTSVILRKCASEHRLVLIVLAQLNRAVEGREKFIPKMGDLKDSGQWEQDADVILFLVWPHRLDNARNPHEFFVFVGKNRNRPINQAALQMRFEPSRQMLSVEKASASRDRSYAVGDWDSDDDFR
jgi:hypothetical protein